MLNTAKSYFSKTLSVAESIPVKAQHIIVAILLVGVIRSLLELFGSDTTFPVTWYSSIVLHQIAFYACAYFLFLLLLKIIIPKVEEQRLKSVVLFGIFAGLLPPVIDLILPASFFGYTYFSQFTWSLFSPEQPIGESITLWMVISGIGLYAWYKTQSFIRSLLATISAYIIFQFLGFIVGLLSVGLFTILAPVLGVPLYDPESVSLAVAGPQRLALQGSAVLVLLGCLITTLAIYRWPVFKMALLRLPHALVWGALVLFGAGLAANGVDAYLLLKAIVMIVFFMFIQIENDYFDKSLDTLTGRNSPVKLDDLYIMRSIIALTIILFLIFDSAFGLLLGLFITLSVIYSHRSFYLKRHFITGSIIEGSAAFVAVLAGAFYFSTIQAGATVWYIALGALLFGIFANIRDYKDVEGDKQGGIITLYTWLAKRGIDPKKTHIFLWLPILLATVLNIIYLIFWVATSPTVYGIAFILSITALLPMYFIKMRRLSTTLAVTHVVSLLLVISLYILPTIVS